MVIDDFSVIRATYPDVQNENLFLPYLLFYLRREGITSLLVNTDPEKPGPDCRDRFEQEFRALVDNRLYTWHVPFFGEDKVAIAAIPPIGRAGVRVRELLPARKHPVDLTVDPHFELYTGLEEGEPEPVPLEVRLFRETPAFEQYINHENLVFGELFKAAPTRHTVIVGQPLDEYDALRDFCSLASQRHLNHTLVFQVDEFWGMQRGGLRSQCEYLEGTSVDADGKPAADVDSLVLFRKSEAGRIKKTPIRRSNFFAPKGYNLGTNPKERQAVDRIPFTWDFGFLLCRENCWIEAKDKDLTLRGNNGQLIKVGNVWKALTKPEGARARALADVPEVQPRPEFPGAATSWRAFLEACQLVAQARGSKTMSSVPAFDLSLLAPESFSCLVLEIWASEILRNNKPLAEAVCKREWESAPAEGLVSWLVGKADKTISQQCHTWLESASRGTNGAEGRWLELYKAWLLLAESLNLPDFVEPTRSYEFKPREGDRLAVAIRHWYKSAAAQSDTFDPLDPVLPCRLPGSFSVRGDWFLAVRQGSRSDRLADQALDLLSSRRGNMTRLQAGLGLPTRQTVNDPHDLLRVRLFKSCDQGQREKVTYKSLRAIGANEQEEFHWFWRSRLLDYDRQARVWQKWLGRTLLFWNRMRFDLRQNWVSGFRAYDSIDQGTPSKPEKALLTSFAKRCDFLVSELRDCTLR